MTTLTNKGQIAKIVRDKGFGFIKGEDGKEYFFHRSSLDDGVFDALQPGDAVQFIAMQTHKGMRATGVVAVAQE
jgi:CspA family cold shock protein